MMNARILQILQAPDLIKVSDVDELRREISNYPYVQPLRALYLLSLNKFQPESYQKELAVTAAYTTDKKILYQLVNPAVRAFVSNTEKAKPVAEEVKEVPVLTKEEPRNYLPSKIYTPGSFPLAQKASESEGKSEPISVEETKVEIPEVVSEPVEASKVEKIVEETTVVSVSEPILETGEVSPLVENEISTQEEVESKVEAETPVVKEEPVQHGEFSGETNFGGSDTFLPNVKFNVSAQHAEYAQPKTPNVVPVSTYQPTFVTTVANAIPNESPEKEIVEEEMENSTQLSFSEINHDVEEVKEVVETKQEEPAIEITPEMKDEPSIEPIASDSWAPMSFEAHIPDALIGRKVENVVPQVVAKPIIAEEKLEEPIVEQVEEAPESVAEIVELAKEDVKTDTAVNDIVKEEAATEGERPVINFSFFGGENAAKQKEEIKEEIVKEKEDMKEEVIEDKKETHTAETTSNVISFINTWQNWLHKTAPQNMAEERKAQAIDKFIENNPRISSLKEDNDYTVKDRGDDISHLMTETLANLYLEQRLYTKAVNAFEILKTKFPDREKDFQDRINYIKDIRSGKIQPEN